MVCIWAGQINGRAGFGQQLAHPSASVGLGSRNGQHHPGGYGPLSHGLASRCIGGLQRSFIAVDVVGLEIRPSRRPRGKGQAGRGIREAAGPRSLWQSYVLFDLEGSLMFTSKRSPDCTNEAEQSGKSTGSGIKQQVTR